MRINPIGIADRFYAFRLEVKSVAGPKIQPNVPVGSCIVPQGTLVGDIAD
jgi:hypothetical protein